MDDKDIIKDCNGNVLEIGDIIKIKHLDKEKIEFLRDNDIYTGWNLVERDVYGQLCNSSSQGHIDLLVNNITESEISVIEIDSYYIIVVGALNYEQRNGFDENLFVIKINYIPAFEIIGHSAINKKEDVFFNLNAFFYVFEDEEYVYLCSWNACEWKNNISLYCKIEKDRYYSCNDIIDIKTYGINSVSEGYKKYNPEIFQEETFVVNGFDKHKVEIVL